MQTAGTSSLVPGVKVDFDCPSAAKVRAYAERFADGIDQLATFDGTSSVVAEREHSDERPNDAVALAIARVADALLAPEARFMNLLVALGFSSRDVFIRRQGRICGNLQSRLPPRSSLDDQQTLTEGHKEAMVVHVAINLLFDQVLNDTSYKETAAFWMDVLLERFRRDARVLVWRAGIYIGESKPSECLVLLKKAVKIDPVGCFNAFYTLGNILVNLCDRNGDTDRYFETKKQISAAFRAFLEHAPPCHWHTPRACMLLVSNEVEDLVNRRLNVRLYGPLPPTPPGERHEPNGVKLDEIARVFPDETAELLHVYANGLDAISLRNQWATPEARDWQHVFGTAKGIAERLGGHMRSSARRGGGAGSGQSQVPESLKGKQRCSLIRCGIVGRHSKCSKCKAVFYCCAEHQREDWRSGHKKVCASLRTQRKSAPIDLLDEFDELMSSARAGGGGPQPSSSTPHWDPATCSGVGDLPVIAFDGGVATGSGSAAAAPPPETRDCANCGAKEGSVPHAPCSRCKNRFYCGKACQKTHWKRGGHKQNCRTPEQREAQSGAWPDVIVPPPRSPSHIFVIIHPMFDQGGRQRRRSSASVTYLVYESYEPEELREKLRRHGGKGGAVVLLNPGTYELARLGLPHIVAHSLEVIGVNGASRDSVVVNSGRGSDWGMVVGGAPSSDNGPPERQEICWLRLAHLTFHAQSGEGGVVLRPGFRGFHARPAKHVPVGAALFDVALTGGGTVTGGLEVCRDGALVLERCSVADCPGAGLLLNDDASATVTDCTFRRTGLGTTGREEGIVKRGQDPAIFIWPAARLAVRRTTFEDNEGHALQKTKPGDAGGGGPIDAGMTEALKMMAAMTGMSVEETMNTARESRVRSASAASRGRVALAPDNVFARNGLALEPRRRQNTYSEPADFHGPDTAIGAALLREEEEDEGR